MSVTHSVDPIIRRLLPTFNPNRDDRARAWNTWLRRGGSDPVLKFIRWANGTSTDDEEVLQETLIVGYLKVERGQYEYRNVPFTAFLKKIAWYKIMEASRKFAHMASLDDMTDDYLADEENHHDRVEDWKEREALQCALQQLPPRRSHIVMLYEHGYSTAEIAYSLGIREELVRKEKSLGMRQLRQTLKLAS
jgi:RNA polymerase sigma factor (sigma-70 family)